MHGILCDASTSAGGRHTGPFTYHSGCVHACPACCLQACHTYLCWQFAVHVSMTTDHLAVLCRAVLSCRLLRLKKASEPLGAQVLLWPAVAEAALLPVFPTAQPLLSSAVAAPAAAARATTLVRKLAAAPAAAGQPRHRPLLGGSQHTSSPCTSNSSCGSPSSNSSSLSGRHLGPTSSCHLRNQRSSCSSPHSPTSVPLGSFQGC